MKRRIIPLLALTVLFVSAATAQGEWKWAHYWTGGDGTYGNYYNQITNTAFDDEGNMYVYGTMGESAAFDGTSLHFTNDAQVLSHYTKSIVLFKFDTLGNMLWHKVVKSSAQSAIPRWMEVRDGRIYISGDVEMEYVDYNWNNVWLYYLDTLIRGYDVHLIPVNDRRPPYKTGTWTFFATLDTDGELVQDHFVEMHSRERYVVNNETCQLVTPLCVYAATYPSPFHIDNQGNIYVYTPIQYKGIESDSLTLIVDGDTNKTYNLFLPGNVNPDLTSACINNALLYKFSPIGELISYKLLVDHTDGIASSYPYNGDSVNRYFYTFFEGVSFDEEDNMYLTGHFQLAECYNGQGGEAHEYPVHFWWDSITHFTTMYDINSAEYCNFVIKIDTNGNIMWDNQLFVRGNENGIPRGRWKCPQVHDGYLYILGVAAYGDGSIVFFDNENNPVQRFLNSSTGTCFFCVYDAFTGEYVNHGIVPALNTRSCCKNLAVLNNRVFAISQCNTFTEYWLVMWSKDGLFIKADTINSTDAVQITNSYGLCINEDGYILASLLSTSPVTFDNNISVNCSTEHSNAVFALYHDPRFAQPFVPDDTVDIAEYQHNRESDIYLYPNPTNGEAIVCGYMYDYRSIELFDLQGRKLADLAESHNGTSLPIIDLTPYPAGTYLVRINFNRGVSVTRKVVKQ